MRNFISKPLRPLCLLPAAVLTFSGSATATSLVDVSSDQIAADVERTYNSTTAQMEYAARDFDPFEDLSDLAGSVRLRSAPLNAVAIDGNYISGGAVIELATLYTTNSPDSWDVRGYERAVFSSGQPASYLRYDTQTLNCSSDTRSVVYDKSYHQGSTFGYIGGLYRLFPHYRGHSRILRNRGYNWRSQYTGFGYGPRYRDRDRRIIHDGRGTRDQNRHRDSDRDRRGVRNNDQADNDGRRNGRDRNSDTRNSDSRHTYGRNEISDVRGPRSEIRTGTRTDIPRREIRINPARDRNNTGTTTVSTVRVTTPDTTAGNRRGSGRNVDRNLSRDEGRQAVRERIRAGSNANTGKAQKRSNTVVRTVKTPTPKAAPKTPKRTQATTQRTNTTKNRSSTARTRNNTERTQSRSSNRTRVNRTVDREFRSKNPKASRSQNPRFFPVASGYARTNVYTSYRCVKEEKAAIHVTDGQLRAARHNGLVVILIDNAGQELPVFIPANYVEGFLKARRQSTTSYNGYP